MIDFEQFQKLLSIYAAATGRAADDVVRQSSKIFAQNAQKETILQTGRGKAGRASSVASARREQLEALKRRIVENHLRRRKNISAPRKYLAKNEISPYLRAVRARVGELASAWNATLIATGGKFAAGTRKHGTKHGDFFLKKNPHGAEATIVVKTSGASLNHVYRAAQNTTRAFFSKQAGFALKKLRPRS